MNLYFLVFYNKNCLKVVMDFRTLQETMLTMERICQEQDFARNHFDIYHGIKLEVG